MQSTTTAKKWKTSKREFDLSQKTLVMGILNLTPDSFSDGGKFNTTEKALKQTEAFIKDGADIIDIGGESTRPNSNRVTPENELDRVIPVIEAIAKRFDIAISIDTSKSLVAKEAVLAGAEIINDISGLRFDEKIAEIASLHQTGLILMHLEGSFESMHHKKANKDIVSEVKMGLNQSLKKAQDFGVNNKQICLDIGIGFSKTFEQNLELIGKLNIICDSFNKYPMLVGVSRKSFIGKILDGVPTDKRLNGTLATNIVAVWNGANIVRVHDVKETVEALKVTDLLKTHHK